MKAFTKFCTAKDCLFWEQNIGSTDYKSKNEYFSWLNWQWVDNSGVLQWLAQELHEAEMSGEKVHIMSHIPPGNGDCLGAWGRNYAKIIERYTILI